MMVDNEDLGAHLLGDIGHCPELRPGAGVDDEEQIAVGEIGLLDAGLERLDAPVGVDPGERRRGRLGVDDADILADRLEDPEHAKLAAERVAVGPDMAGQHHLLAVSQHLHEGCPVETRRGHGSSVEEKEGTGKSAGQPLEAEGKPAVTAPARATSVASWALRSLSDSKRRVSRSRARKSTSRRWP